MSLHDKMGVRDNIALITTKGNSTTQLNLSDPRIKASGSVKFETFDSEGNLKDIQTKDNLVVTAGITHILARMASNTPTVMTHMALGSGSTAAAAGNTALVSEEGRVALTTTSTIEYAATFPAGTATASIVEAGVFNASSSGTMLCRIVFGTVTKAAGDSMTVTWTVTLTAS